MFFDIHLQTKSRNGSQPSLTPFQLQLVDRGTILGSTLAMEVTVRIRPEVLLTLTSR